MRDHPSGDPTIKLAIITLTMMSPEVRQFALGFIIDLYRVTTQWDEDETAIDNDQTWRGGTNVEQ